MLIIFKRYLLLLLIFISQSTYSKEKQIINYSSLYGSKFEFDLDYNLLKSGDMFSKIIKCKLEVYCLKFDSTIVTIPPEYILQQAQEKGYIEFYPDKDDTFFQYIKYKSINIINDKIEGFFIQNFKIIDEEIHPYGWLFYNKDIGLVSFLYISKVLDLNTMKEKKVEEALVLSSHFGLFHNPNN